MNHPRNLREIVENGLCLSCGLCQSIAGADRVRMDWVDPPGRLRPRILEPLDDATEKAILRGCPGAFLDEPLDPERHGPDAREDPSFGPWIGVWKGHASDPGIHHMGSSGGALSALGVYLVESGKVDFVYHVKADENRPMRSRSHVSTNRAEVLEGAGLALRTRRPARSPPRAARQGQALRGDRQAVRHLRNPQHARARPARRRSWCATRWPSPAELSRIWSGSRWMLGRVGFPGGENGEDNLSLFRYRGYGCPGPTRAVDKDGNVYDETYLYFWYGPHGSTHQFRCKICADPTGEATDVSVADAWPGGEPTEEEWGGYSIFVSRTPRGDALMRDAIADGALTVEDDDIAAMYESQPHQAVKKQGPQRPSAKPSGTAASRNPSSATCGSTRPRRSVTGGSSTGTTKERRRGSRGA